MIGQVGMEAESTDFSITEIVFSLAEMRYLREAKLWIVFSESIA